MFDCGACRGGLVGLVGVIGGRIWVPRAGFRCLGLVRPWFETRAGGLWALGFGVRGRVWLPVASLGFLAFPLVLSPSVLGRLAASFNPVGYALLIPVCLRSSHACIVRSRYCVGSYCSAGAGLAGVRFVEPVHVSLLARGDPRCVCCARMGIPVGWLCPGTWVGSRRVWVSGCGAGSWGVRPVGCRRALLIWRAVGRVSRGVALCPGAWIWWGPALVCASYLWWDRPVVALRRRDCRRLRELVLFLSVFFLFFVVLFLYPDPPTSQDVFSHTDIHRRGAQVHT